MAEAGEEHVAFGADFFETLRAMNASLEIPVLNPLPAGPSHPFTALLGPQQVPNLTAELLRRGYDEARLALLFRENILRVLARTAG